MLLPAATMRPDALDVADRASRLSYAEIAEAVEATAAGLLGIVIGRGNRVADWLPKRTEKARDAASHARSDITKHESGTASRYVKALRGINTETIREIKNG
jgi:acyl-CoA synthetase (AMP-forming)/AMP-acid ligase II